MNDYTAVTDLLDAARWALSESKRVTTLVVDNTPVEHPQGPVVEQLTALTEAVQAVAYALLARG